MSKIIINITDPKSYVGEYSKLKITELETVIQELNALITRKKTTAPDFRIKQLYQLIDETQLDIDQQIIFDVLAEKLRIGSMSKEENRVYLNIATKEETIRNQRIAYMVELAQLRNISLSELMVELGLHPPIDYP